MICRSCRTCPADLTTADLRTGCIRCLQCRTMHPRVTKPKDPPKVSWWLGVPAEEFGDVAHTKGREEGWNG
jgi:hypothetical protein